MAENVQGALPTALLVPPCPSAPSAVPKAAIPGKNQPKEGLLPSEGAEFSC